MSSLTRWVLAHKRTVVVSWVVLTIAGIMAAGPASKALDQKFSVPKKEGWETNVAIAAALRGHRRRHPSAASRSSRSRGQDGRLARSTRGAAAVDKRLERALPQRANRLLRLDRRQAPSSPTTGARLRGRLSDAGSRTPQFGDNPEAEKAARAALSGATVGGAPVHLTGFDALQQRSGGNDGPGVLVEALLGGLGALVVLAFVFASFLAVVPIVMAVVSIMTTFLLLLGLTKITDVSPIVQFLIALIGLGVAIDYSLLVVSRWREERSHGRERRRGGAAGDGDRRAARSSSAASRSRSACSP